MYFDCYWPPLVLLCVHCHVRAPSRILLSNFSFEFAGDLGKGSCLAYRTPFEEGPTPPAIVSNPCLVDCPISIIPLMLQPWPLDHYPTSACTTGFDQGAASCSWDCALSWSSFAHPEMSMLSCPFSELLKMRGFPLLHPHLHLAWLVQGVWWLVSPWAKGCRTEIPNHYLEEFILNKNMAGCSNVMSNTVVDLETTYSFLIIQEKVAGG